MREIKRIIIKRALRELKKIMREERRHTYYCRERYGIDDIMQNEKTGEDMIIIR